MNQIEIWVIIAYFVDDHSNEYVYWFKDWDDLEDAEKEMQEAWGAECIKTETASFKIPYHFPGH